MILKIGDGRLLSRKTVWINSCSVHLCVSFYTYPVSLKINSPTIFIMLCDIYLARIHYDIIYIYILCIYNYY